MHLTFFQTSQRTKPSVAPSITQRIPKCFLFQIPQQTGRPGPFFQKPTDPPPRPFRPFFFLRGNVRPSRAAGVRVEAEFGQENPNTVPRELGSMGYVGDETIYVAWERMSGLG